MTKTKSVVHWILGLLISTLGICLCTKSDLGLSMIAACPYALHVSMHKYFAWFSQGTAEYVFEALLLVVVCLIIRKFSWKFLLSFVTAVVAGWCIDGWLYIFGGNGAYASMSVRIIAFVSGMVITSLGIAFFFRTKMPLEVYELAVTEISAKYGWSTKNVKLGFDICMLITATAMGLILEHRLVGVGIATVIMTCVNSFIITFWGKLVDKVERIDETR